MYDSSSLELWFVLAQPLDNEILVHAHILRHCCAFLKILDLLVQLPVADRSLQLIDRKVYSAGSGEEAPSTTLPLRGCRRPRPRAEALPTVLRDNHPTAS